VSSVPVELSVASSVPAHPAASFPAPEKDDCTQLATDIISKLGLAFGEERETKTLKEKMLWALDIASTIKEHYSQIIKKVQENPKLIEEMERKVEACDDLTIREGFKHFRKHCLKEPLEQGWELIELDREKLEVLERPENWVMVPKGKSSYYSYLKTFIYANVLIQTPMIGLLWKEKYFWQVIKFIVWFLTGR